MRTGLFIGVVLASLAGAGLAGSTAGALAQDQAPAAPSQDDPAGAGPGVRSGNITATGQTVPHPGASQSAGTTSLDKGIQAEDNKIQSSICKGC